jgi:DNA (cytosine-5)-methyltransferase 1
MDRIPQITYGSLFSGVGGMDMGFDQHFQCVFQVEWDKHCQSILRRHWPDVPKWEDVQDVSGHELPPCDILTFGSPCQDLSVAGKRAGIEGGRSSMFFEATRIIKEMRDATNGTFPRITVWENVPGALSSNKGEDFGAVLEALGDIGAVDIQWSVLDAQHFGVPQRRRRIFLVAVFDPAIAARCPEEILPVFEGRRGDFAKGTKKGQDTPSDSREGADDDSDQNFRMLGFGHYTADDTASTVQQRDHKYATDLIFQTGAQAPLEPVLVYDGFNQKLDDSDVHRTLRIGRDSSDFVAQPVLAHDPGTVGPLTATGMSRARGTETVESNHVVCFTAQRVGEAPRIYEDSTPALLSRMGTGGNNTPMVAQQPTIHSFDTQFGSNANVFENISPTLKATQTSPSIHESVIRRLTPTECERLMGYPDDHTRWTDTGREQTDSQRYKQCGNGVATPVAQWIATQLHTLITNA